MGTALIGSVLIATLSTVALTGVANSPEVSDAVKSQVSSELVGGVPFVSDAQLSAGLTAAGVSPAEIATITEINADARLEALQIAFALVGMVAMGALFIPSRTPPEPPGAAVPSGAPPNPGEDEPPD